MMVSCTTSSLWIIWITGLRICLGFPIISFTGFTVANTKQHMDITKRGIRLALSEFLVKNNMYTGPDVDDLNKIIEHFGTDLDWKKQYHLREQTIIDFVNKQKESKLAHVHCNAEQIEEAHAYVQKLRKQIKLVASTSYPDLQLLRENIGICLYTIQEFYSTTNWVEMMGRTPNKNFGVPGRRLMDIAGPNVDTCSDCDNSGNVEESCKNNLLVSNMLTSGYQTGQDVEPPYKANNDMTTGKCGFGGSSDTENGQRTASGGINKDRLDKKYSPHNFHHFDAYFNAFEASRQFLIDPDIGIINDMPNNTFQNIFGLIRKASYGFAIDVSGSMRDDIDKVAIKCWEIVTNVTGTVNEPSNYILTTFSDPEDLTKHIITTEDGYLMSSTIDSLTVAGGGDCPEYSVSGLQSCINECDENSIIFLFTDAGAKDEERRNDVMDTAVDKNIKVFPILTGTCSGGRYKRQTESETDVYYEIAASTGGEVYQISQSDISTVMEKIVEKTYPSSTAIIDVFTTNPEDASATFPIDSMMTGFSVLITGGSSTTEIDISSEYGSVPYQASIESKEKLLFTVNEPLPGIYNLTVNGYNALQVKITAATYVDFDFVIFEISADGNLISLSGNPIQGRAYAIYITTYNLPANASVSSVILKNQEGQKQHLNVTSMKATLDSMYLATANFSSESLQISVCGLDNNGMEWIRTSSAMISVVSVKLTLTSLPDLYIDTVANISYTLQNLGTKSDVFEVVLTDNRGILFNETRDTVKIFNITEGGSVDIQFEIGGSLIYDTITYFINIKKNGTNTVLQKDRKTIFISQEVPPICTINILNWDCSSSSVNQSCSSVTWKGQATINFTTELHSVKGTSGLNIDYSNIDISLLIVNVNGDCCMTSAYITAIDKNSNSVRCHFYIGAPTYGGETPEKTLTTAEKIAIGVVAGIVAAVLLVVVVLAVILHRGVVKPKRDAMKIATMNVKATKDFPFQNDKSSKQRFHEAFASLKYDFGNSPPRDTKYNLV